MYSGWQGIMKRMVFCDFHISWADDQPMHDSQQWLCLEYASGPRAFNCCIDFVACGLTALQFILLSDVLRYLHKHSFGLKTTPIPSSLSKTMHLHSNMAGISAGKFLSMDVTSMPGASPISFTVYGW